MRCTFPGCRDDVHARGLCPKHYQRAYRAGTITEAPRAPGPPPQHGTRSRYRKGCRDRCCRDAERLYRRRYRARRTTAA